MSSEQSRNWICHTVLSLLTSLMTSSGIWKHNTCIKKRHLYTKRNLTLVCFVGIWWTTELPRSMASQRSIITWRLAYIHPKGIQGHDKQGGLEKIKIKNSPPNRNLIDSKWVFKREIYGRLRARIVAQEYTQVSGLHSTKNYSPLVTDVTP